MRENSILKSIMLVGIGIALGSGINTVSSSSGEDKATSASSMPPAPPGPYRSTPADGTVMPQTKAPLYPPVNMATPPWQQAQRQMMPPARQHPAWARPAPRPEWAKRPERPQRPEWAKRPVPQQYPAWAQQAPRPEWGKRPERPQRPEWAKRPESQQRPAWAQRPPRPDWAKRPERPQRPEWARRPQANTWAQPPVTYGYGYPPVPAYIAPWGYGPGAGWGQVRR